jgi:hypothetical protein
MYEGQVALVLQERTVTNKERYLAKLAELKKLKEKKPWHDQTVIDLQDELGILYQSLSQDEIMQVAKYNG